MHSVVIYTSLSVSSWKHYCKDVTSCLPSSVDSCYSDIVRHAPVMVSLPGGEGALGIAVQVPTYIMRGAGRHGQNDVNNQHVITLGARRERH